MVLRGQGTQSGAIGEVKGPKVVPLGTKGGPLRGHGRQKWPCQWGLSVRVMEIIGNRAEPGSGRTPKLCNLSDI